MLRASYLPRIAAWFCRPAVALLGILLFAALLRFPRLTQHDVIDDEALMAFRSVGWLDTWFGSMQSPVDLFPTEQWWQKFSFHDHPPLLFFVEHKFFRLFGPTELALRLPFALAGVLVVYLMYLVGREIFGPRGALLSAAVAAVANYSVWLSRVGFQEGLLLVPLLATVWFFLRSLDDPRCCVGVGAALGAALLTKYSAVVMVPVIVGGYLVYRRDVWRSIYCWVGAALTVALMSPVAVYNGMLFATRGHFDATLTAMLGQTHPDLWSDYHAYSGFRQWTAWWHWAPEGFGWLLIAVVLAGFATLAVRSVQSAAVTTPRQRAARWVLVSLTVSTVMFLSLSPGRKQYVGLAVIPVSLLAGYALSSWMSGRRGPTLVAIVIAVLALQTANTQLRAHPSGIPHLTYLTLRPASFVYRQLDAYLDRIFAGRDPAVTTTADPQVRDYIHRRLRERFGSDVPTFPTRPPYVIYDERMDFAAVRWTMLRRDVYLYQPTMMTMKLAETAKLHGADYMGKSGFTDFRLIFVEPPLLEQYGTPARDVTVANYMRQKLDQAGVQPETYIAAADGTPAFAVYRVGRVSPLVAPWDESATDAKESAP